MRYALESPEKGDKNACGSHRNIGKPPGGRSKVFQNNRHRPDSQYDCYLAEFHTDIESQEAQPDVW
ncbi:MAG: hypothetical protein ABJR23_21375 [Paracoccaceae bacterium]